jgi:hypothetical protein
VRTIVLLGLMCWLGFGVEGCASRALNGTQPTWQSGKRLNAQPMSSDLRTVRGGRHLAGLHPTLRRKALQLYAECERAGVAIKFISGYRKMRARKKRASWHNFGMAFDMNLAEHRDMKTAVSRYRRDKSRWAVVGRIGRSLGMFWGEVWKVEEIFHFEWHPGMPEGLRGANLRTLLRDAGPMAERPANAWHHFKE